MSETKNYKFVVVVSLVYYYARVRAYGALKRFLLNSYPYAVTNKLRSAFIAASIHRGAKN